jgi:pilus assembly protein CpaE
MQQPVNPDTIVAEAAPSNVTRRTATEPDSFLAFVGDEETEAALRGGLIGAAPNLSVVRGKIQQAIKHLEREATPRFLVVDIVGHPNPFEALDRLAAVCAPDVKVLVVGDNTDHRFYRQLVRTMGVTEYLAKPVTRDAVLHVFRPLLMAGHVEAESARHGSVIAVCGARGGVGATTIAVNLALQLARTAKSHVCLLDMHLQRGTAALMLGMRAASGLRVALESPDRADELFLERASIQVFDRLRLIAAEESFERQAAPTRAGAAHLVDLLKRRFNHVVVDLPPPGQDAERQILRSARHLIVVLMPDLAGIRDAQRLQQLAAKEGGVPVTVVLNRVGQPGALALGLVQEGLGQSPAIQIPDVSKQLVRAANLGLPALDRSPAFAKTLLPLTRELSGLTARPEGSSGGLKLPRWLARR